MQDTNWKLPLIIVIGIVAAVLTIIFGVQGTSNHAIALEEQVNTAKSDIKIQEKRRVDLVYNLVDCVKEYDRFTTNEFINSVTDVVIDNLDKCIATLNPNCNCINAISVLSRDNTNNEMQKGVFYDRRVFR